MKAYVIKNKEGKYFCGFDSFAGINIFSERIIDGLNTQTPTLKHCREEIKDFDLKECESVKITIAEGDLEKENRVLKEALLHILNSYGCVSEVCVDESKLHISSEKAVDEIRSCLSEMAFAFDDLEEKLGNDYFIKARKQLAKENKYVKD